MPWTLETRAIRDAATATPWILWAEWLSSRFPIGETRASRQPPHPSFRHSDIGKSLACLGLLAHRREMRFLPIVGHMILTCRLLAQDR